MAKVLFYKNNRNNITITVLLFASVVITNSFIVFSQGETIRSFFANLTSTITVGIPMVIAFVMVFRYKRDMKKQGDRPQVFSAQDNAILNYYDDNKMHLSICLFLVLWFIAHIIWTSSFSSLPKFLYKMYFGSWDMYFLAIFCIACIIIFLEMSLSQWFLF